MESPVQRKLTAILKADVQGDSRLLGAHQEATRRRLREYRQILARLSEEHGGHLVNAPGDRLGTLNTVTTNSPARNRASWEGAEFPW